MRSLPEWIGRTPDTPVPPRVRIRVRDRDGGRCKCGCGRIIRVGDKWQTDHIIAIINGGENRESNLRTLLTACHLVKTMADVSDKAAAYERRLSHLGLRKAKRPMPCGKRSNLKKTMSGKVVPRMSQVELYHALMEALGRTT